MELQNSRQLPVAQDVVWIALNDPGVLRQCIPGCESLDRIDDQTWSVVMTASIGPVKARFTGKITLTDIVAPASYTLNFDGQGGAAGFGRGTAQVTLQSQGPRLTLLTYDARAQVGGKLAQIGARLIDGAARKLADDFFTRFTEVVAPGSSAAASTPDPVAADGEVAAALATEAAERDSPPARSLLGRWWPWLVAAVILLLILVWGKHAG